MRSNAKRKAKETKKEARARWRTSRGEANAGGCYENDVPMWQTTR